VTICSTADSFVLRTKEKWENYFNWLRPFWSLVHNTIQTFSVVFNPTFRFTLPCQVYEIHTTSLYVCLWCSPAKYLALSWANIHRPGKASVYYSGLCDKRCCFMNYWSAAALQSVNLNTLNHLCPKWPHRFKIN